MMTLSMRELMEMDGSGTRSFPNVDAELATNLNSDDKPVS